MIKSEDQPRLHIDALVRDRAQGPGDVTGTTAPPAEKAVGLQDRPDEWDDSSQPPFPGERAPTECASSATVRMHRRMTLWESSQVSL